MLRIVLGNAEEMLRIVLEISAEILSGECSWGILGEMSEGKHPDPHPHSEVPVSTCSGYNLCHHG